MYPKIPLLLVKIVLCFDSLITKNTKKTTTTTKQQQQQQKKKKKKNRNFEFKNRNLELELKNRKNSAKIGWLAGMQ